MADFRKLHTTDPRGYDATRRRQEIQVGDSTDIGLWGGGAQGERLRVLATDPKSLLVIEQDDFRGKQANLRLFQLTGLSAGELRLEARNAQSAVWASLNVVVIPPPKAISTDMVYNGITVTWREHAFRATSGMVDAQRPELQCAVDLGPIPNGIYSLTLREAPGSAHDDGTGLCNLAQGTFLERIPRGSEAGECEVYWANWGTNRIRLLPADAITKTRSCRYRDGFYLHDSTKGYTHGCIEVEPRFFDGLRAYMRKSPKVRRLHLRVSYVPGRQTNGGTRSP